MARGIGRPHFVGNVLAPEQDDAAAVRKHINRRLPFNKQADCAALFRLPPIVEVAHAGEAAPVICAVVDVACEAAPSPGVEGHHGVCAPPLRDVVQVLHTRCRQVLHDQLVNGLEDLLQCAETAWPPHSILDKCSCSQRLLVQPQHAVSSHVIYGDRCAHVRLLAHPDLPRCVVVLHPLDLLAHLVHHVLRYEVITHCPLFG
mmetsp:Transcript_39363/g.87595  ORF Transcript_39363/g.87595 Transcript_39363/m.87595 type:complete len:202 (-) Transcript_39363:52-657(-)